MRRISVSLLAALLLIGGLLVYRKVDACHDWQDRYKRYLYTEIMKNSPVILTPEMIEELIGERPSGCERPGRSLTAEEIARFREEGVGSNEFADQVVDFARYLVSVDVPVSQIMLKEGQSRPPSGLVTGVLEMAAADGSACLTLTGVTFQSVSVTNREELIHFSSEGSRQGAICVEASPDDLHQYIRDPAGYRLEVLFADGTATEASVSYLAQST